MMRTITKEIMLAMATAEQGIPYAKNVEHISINDLRIALYERDLDTNGPRELPTFRLKK